jgi:cyclopropane fatty-acyl-phospholipid synthase-like methyltransferase
LLDIGCGWGGLVIYAAQRYGVKAHGVTFSAQQAELARQRIKKAGLEESPKLRSLAGKSILRSAPGWCSTTVQTIGSAEVASGFQMVPSHKRTATFDREAGLNRSSNKDNVVFLY